MMMNAFIEMLSFLVWKESEANRLVSYIFTAQTERQKDLELSQVLGIHIK